MQLRFLPVALAAVAAFAADQRTDPTFLRRSLGDVKAVAWNESSRYKPLFGEGDAGSGIVRSVARFGELAVDAGGRTPAEERPREEQVWLVLQGGGVLTCDGKNLPLTRHDFVYIPPGAKYEFAASSPARLIVMGWRLPQGLPVQAGQPQVANVDDVPKQVVASHPPSTLYQLLVGPRDSQRDRLRVTQVLTSLFTMEFAAGGTNIPHHHEQEEEVYLVLDGRGDMVAGGGMDGVEGRFPAKAGDAFFFRLNTTVGFYAGNRAAEPKARILAARSLFPFRFR